MGLAPKCLVAERLRVRRGDREKDRDREIDRDREMETETGRNPGRQRPDVKKISCPDWRCGGVGRLN